MPYTQPEPFVDLTTAADFLQIKPRHLVELARAGQLPAYPLGAGARKVWRFRLSALTAAMERLASRQKPVEADYPSNEEAR